jgi:hypothetical protein
MPRWASRLTLEVVSVRIERVQDISEADAVAEGVDGCGVSWWGGVMSGTARVMRANAVIAFHDLWDSINAPRGFGRDANPWVRVVEFKTLQLRGSNV